METVAQIYVQDIKGRFFQNIQRELLPSLEVNANKRFEEIFPGKIFLHGFFKFDKASVSNHVFVMWIHFEQLFNFNSIYISVRVGEHALNREKERVDGKSDRPVVTDAIEADITMAGNVRVEDASDEANNGRAKRVRTRKLDQQVERSILVGRILGASYGSLPNVLRVVQRQGVDALEPVVRQDLHLHFQPRRAPVNRHPVLPETAVVALDGGRRRVRVYLGTVTLGTDHLEETRLASGAVDERTVQVPPEIGRLGRSF